MTCVDVDNWDLLKRSFRAFFEGLGRVETDEAHVAFESLPPAVLTSLSIERDGRCRAAMPLHELTLNAVALDLDAELAELRLLGEGGVSYTYRLPRSLLAGRR